MEIEGPKDVCGCNASFDRPVLRRYRVDPPPKRILRQDDLHVAGLEQLKLINLSPATASGSHDALNAQLISSIRLKTRRISERVEALTLPRTDATVLPTDLMCWH